MIAGHVDVPKTLLRVRRRFCQGVKQHALIAPSDHILVGLSGGKDSLALLQLLGEMRRKRGNTFRLTALHVSLRGMDYLADAAWLREQAEAAGADFILEQCELPEDRNERRSPCFLCSWQRRKVLFRVAQDIGAEKIALGHHYDDIITTALMNLTCSGQFTSMPPLLRLDKMPITIIRPLCRVHEDDLKVWAEHHAYRAQTRKCPHETQGKRMEAANLLQEMLAVNPEARESIWHALKYD